MADTFDQLERMQWSSHTSPSKGPRRLCKFCLLGIIVPVLFLVVPLYIRYQALRPHLFTLSPSDMKLLNQESRVSTIWCEGQDLKMNSTFNAYLLKHKPKIKRLRHHITMHRKMILQDDIKEYWGFYLIRRSTVKLKVCSRHEGAGFIIVKGLKDARRCSYLGELDSNEEDSDEISDEFEFSHEILEGNGDFEARNLSKVSTKNDEFEHLNTLSKPELVQLYMAMLERYGKADVHKQFQAFQRKYSNRFNSSSDSEVQNPINLPTGITSQNHLDDAEDDPIGEMIDNDGVYDLMHQGRFNQTTKNDKSREEVQSSWSSSEEALARCEGLIYNVPLNGGTRCTPETPRDTLERISTEVTLDVAESGFYYFIFANENEITDNFLSATFDLHKSVFDVSSNVQNCTNSTSCHLPLNFWSREHVVLEVPNEDQYDPCDALLGYSSLAECHRVVMAESVCKPRKMLYIGFLLVVPILILIFAHI